MSSWIRVGIGTLAVAVVLAGCTASSDPSPSVTSTPVLSSTELPSEAETPSATAVPRGQKTDLSAAERHARGESGTVDGVTFTVLASQVQKRSEQTIRRVETHAVKLKLCAGSRPVELMSDRWYLVDGAGHTYLARQEWASDDDNPSLGDPSPPYPNLETLPPSRCQEGWLVFETPDGTIASQLVHDSINGTDHVWAL